MSICNDYYPLIHPYGKIKIPIAPLKFVKGDGIYVYDENGKRYINAISGLWNLCLGLGNKKVENAIKDQLGNFPYFPLFNFTHDPAIKLAEKLIKITNNCFSGVYLTCSGSAGVELAIKTSWLYHCVLKKSKKKKIISLENSYHGTTYAALSASNLENNRSLKLLPRLDSFDYVKSPYCYRCPFGNSYPNCQFDCALSIEKLFASRGDTIAALIMEPVLASGGNIVPPYKYFQKVQELCSKYDVLLIVDEVATGMGRSGRMLASELFNIKPDILILSKGLNAGYLPIGAVLFSKQILSVLADNHVNIPHGSTQDGNPISCKAALATFEYFEEENLVNNVQKVGESLLLKLRETLSYPIIGDIRGVGLMIGIELVENKETKKTLSFSKITQILLQCIQKGLLVYPFEKGISIFPPLVIDNHEAMKIISILDDVFLNFQQKSL